VSLVNLKVTAMRNTKIIVSTIILLIAFTTSIQAQNPLSQTTQTELGLGVALPFLTSGSELMSSKAIRDSGLSYFEDADGSRKPVGSYGRLIGWSVSTGFYVPIKKAKGLMLGSSFKTSLTGVQPSEGEYAEGYFFNFLSVGVGAKYYPFTKNNLFVKTDFGLASVFTKNRYLNVENEQSYFHQFGIGTNVSASVGYSFTPFKNKLKSFDVQAIFQQNNTRVEVNGIGNDNWSFIALNFMVFMNF